MPRPPGSGPPPPARARPAGRSKLYQSFLLHALAVVRFAFGAAPSDDAATMAYAKSRELRLWPLATPSTPSD